MFLDIGMAREFICEAIEHYSSLNVPPWFIDYLDFDIYVRLGEKPGPITIDELLTLQRLKEREGWKPEHYAVNDVYKLFDRLKRDTAGMVSY